MKDGMFVVVAAGVIGFVVGGFVGAFDGHEKGVARACGTVRCPDGETSVWVESRCRCLGKPVAP